MRQRERESEREIEEIPYEGVTVSRLCCLRKLGSVQNTPPLLVLRVFRYETPSLLRSCSSSILFETPAPVYRL